MEEGSGKKREGEPVPSYQHSITPARDLLMKQRKTYFLAHTHEAGEAELMTFQPDAKSPW